MRIKVHGQQIDNNNNIIDEIQLVTDAIIKKENNLLIVDYTEDEQDDNEIIKTRLRISDNKLSMTKLSTLSSTLEFEVNKQYYTVYSTIYGDFQMVISTLEYTNSLNDNGIGEITLKYRITIGNNEPYINNLKIKIFS